MNDNGTYNPDALLQERTGLTPAVRTWSVIGFWFNDEPVPVGVVEGDHQVYGGDALSAGYDSPVDGSQGPWAVSVTAPDAETAEELAVEQMLDECDDDDEEEDEA
jgi:hypothetical protein